MIGLFMFEVSTTTRMRAWEWIGVGRENGRSGGQGSVIQVLRRLRTVKCQACYSGLLNSRSDFDFCEAVGGWRRVIAPCYSVLAVSDAIVDARRVRLFIASMRALV